MNEFVNVIRLTFTLLIYENAQMPQSGPNDHCSSTKLEFKVFGEIIDNNHYLA